MKNHLVCVISSQEIKPSLRVPWFFYFIKSMNLPLNLSLKMSFVEYDIPLEYPNIGYVVPYIVDEPQF